MTCFTRASRSVPAGPLAAAAVLLLASLAGVACGDRKERASSEAYARAIAAHEARLSRFQVRYVRLERQVARLRRKRPAEAVRPIRQEMIPLLDSVIASLDRVIRAGRAYVARLPDSIATKRELQAQIARFERQRRLLGTVRGTYVEEARLLAHGAPRHEALQGILDRRLDAARRLERGGAPRAAARERRRVAPLRRPGGRPGPGGAESEE